MTDLRIVQGTHVDLLTPLPPGEVQRVFGWNHCFRTFCENDDVPTNIDAFTSYVRELLAICPSWGVVDKNQLTNQKHEAPLVGVVMLEPAGQRCAYLHFASARKAFKMGLIDEAAELVVETAFTSAPSLLRLGAYVDETNGPAKGLLKRLGFRFEGVCHDAILRGKELRNLVYYGLPRRCWESRGVIDTSVTSEVVPSEVEPTNPIPSAEAA